MRISLQSIRLPDDLCRARTRCRLADFPWLVWASRRFKCRLQLGAKPAFRGQSLESGGRDNGRAERYNNQCSGRSASTSIVDTSGRRSQLTSPLTSWRIAAKVSRRDLQD